MMNPLLTPDKTTAGEAPVASPATRPRRIAGPRTLGDMALEAAERHGGIALQQARDGETLAISYPEFGAIVTEIARGLIALGIETGDRVAILGATTARCAPAQS
jgi:long-subunit acyl-CoA synthetase (AMP-forming)